MGVLTPSQRAWICIHIVSLYSLFLLPLLDGGVEELIFEIELCLLDTFSLQDCILWDSSKQIPQEAEVCSPELRFVILLFALLPSLGTLNSTMP